VILVKTFFFLIINKKTGISAFWKKTNQFISIIIPEKYFPELIVPDENQTPPLTPVMGAQLLVSPTS